MSSTEEPATAPPRNLPPPLGESCGGRRSVGASSSPEDEDPTFSPARRRRSAALHKNADTREPGARTPARAWLALAGLLLAIAFSAAVQWELLPPAWLPRLPALWGAAALLGAAAWRFSSTVLPEPEPNPLGSEVGPRTWLAPQVIAAILCLAAGLALLYRDLLSQAGTALWALGIAAVPATMAWSEHVARAALPAAPPTRAGRRWLWHAAGLALLLLALGLRLHRLDEIPAKYLDDEGAVSDWGLSYLHGTPVFGQHLAAPITLFRNGATAYPLLGSYVHALVMQVAGETIFGSRLTSVLAGALCVLVVYAMLADRVERWAALAAALLFAFCHTHLFWSRFGTPQSLTTTAVATFFWLTLRAMRSGSYATAALAGVVLGLAQYFYEGARFFVPVLAGFFLVCAVFERGFVRARAVHVIVMALMAGLVFAPIGFWYIDHPTELMARSRGVLIFAQPEYLASRYPGLDTMGIVQAQLRRALEGLAYGGDGANFFSLRGPILDPVTRTLLVAGIFAIFSIRDRLRLLVSLWLWLPIAIVCIPTVDPPSMTRLIQIVPAVFVVAGLMLDRLGRVAHRAAGRAGVAVIGVAGFAAVAYGARWDLAEFFQRYPLQHVADPQTVGAKLLAQIDRAYQVRVLGGMSFYAPSVRFLARGLTGEDLPPDAIPLPGRDGRDSLVLVAANAGEQIGQLRATYPTAVEAEHRNTRGDLLLLSFRVPATAVNAAAGADATWRLPNARFGMRGNRLGEFGSPRALVIDGRGYVYVADTANRRIEVFRPDGSTAFAFGGAGSDSAEIGSPVSLAFLADGSLLALGREPFRLKRYKPDGTWIADVDVRDKLEAPIAVAAAKEGFYVLDQGRGLVLQVKLDGEVIARSAGRGAGVGQLDNPMAMAAGADGRLYIYDAGNHRLVRLSLALMGELTWPLDLADDRLGQAIAVGPAGDERVYVANPGSGAVQRFTPDGTFEWLVGMKGDYPGDLAWPVVVALDAEGKIYVADENRGQIFRYDLPQGTALTPPK